MKDLYTPTRQYVSAHKDYFITGGWISLAVLIIIAVTMIYIYNVSPKIVYQPVHACDLLTPAKAQELLGKDVIASKPEKPVIADETATSKCSYTDENPSQDAMRVAALAIRAGINDEGVAKNKSDFEAAKANNAVEVIENLGESAFFNKTNGQLNVIKGYNWLIINYGVGTDPQSNTIEQATELARLVTAK
jgi:hypothetical protein